MGQGKSPLAKIKAKAMTEEEYLGKMGVSAPASGYVIDKLRGNKQLGTLRGKKRFERARI